MGERLANWVIKWRFAIVAVTLALVVAAGSGARFLLFDTDYRIWFSEDNPQLQAFETIQNTYTKYDNLLFVLVPKDGDVFTRSTLAAVEWLTEQAWQVPYSIRVDSLSNFQHTRGEADELIVQDLYTDAESLTDADLEYVRQTALSEPLLVNRLVSPRSHTTGVNVTVQPPGIRTDLEVPEIAEFCRDLAENMKQRFPDIEVRLTGIVMMNNAFPEASRHDISTLIPLMFAVVVLVLALMTRSVVGTLGTVLVIAFTVIMTMGLAGWSGMKLTGASASAPTIILTLAVADCVHILVNFIHAMRNGAGKYPALAESLRINLQPVFLTSITTAIGFLSMNFGDVPPFRDMGNLVALGVMLAFAFAVIFLPAFIAIMPIRVRQRQTHGDRAMTAFAEWVIKRRQMLLWVVGPLMLFLIAFIPRNEFNDEFVKYFDESIQFRRDTDFTTQNLTGIYTIQYSLNAGESSGISDPEFLAKVEEFAQWFRQHPDVLHVNSITDTLKRLNKNLHADSADWYKVPQQRDLAAQYLLLYEMSLPYGLDLNDQINIDKSATRFVVTTQSLSTKKTLEMVEQAREWLMDSGLARAGDIEGSSPNIMFAHITGRNIRSMLVGTTVALILISLILIVALRSLKLGLISMVPNLLPAALAFGLWGIVVGQVGLSISVVSAMSLGIIVDDTVHFLTKYTRARREQGMSAADAVRYAFSTVGMALWVTSLVLVAGFLVLSQSAFQVNSGMGLLTAIVIVFALVADFLFLPPLLIKLSGKRLDLGIKATTEKFN
ncbi:MAG: MMPL family transporter [Arenicellales bacterium]|nr:MMPL family transporter [Arenicellales bacterium]